MTPQPIGRTITQIDHEYAFLHQLWLKNQRSCEFDWQGKEGGIIVRVYDNTVANPDFHVLAEAGPTLLDETAPGGPLTIGFEILMQARGQIRYTAPSHNRRGRIVKIPLPMQRSNL